MKKRVFLGMFVLITSLFLSFQLMGGGSANYYKLYEPCYEPRGVVIECYIGGTQTCTPSGYCNFWP